MTEGHEEQRPIPQTFCGALQKEANCKCLVLSVLIYGCLAAVTWCRCANVTKFEINYFKYPIKSTKHVSPCDDGYIYIPVAFMGMLYLVYLVECYHSPIRIDLLHSESQDGILAKLTQLKLAQASIWWKAISYHYVRRKRQITRYRNGDNYTTTQVYYERVNTHAATSYYFYGYCGVKDITKDLTLDPKIPITKISLMKGFAFSNMRSATEFEEARSRFFAEQEHRDDYMEMREGLDLGYNFNPTSLVAVFGNPWFTNCYVYWCLSALLLSWPLRIIIECNTQYADYQITKLFGVSYDTPANGQPIHASSGQLSAPGSYMLAPSYSEALLMEPAVSGCEERDTEMVPSYSEALLYERAHGLQSEVNMGNYNENIVTISNCECPCHSSGNANESESFPEENDQISIENGRVATEDSETFQESNQNQSETSADSESRLGNNTPCVENTGQPITSSCTYSDNENERNYSVDENFTSIQTLDCEVLPRTANNRLNGGFRQNSLEILTEQNDERNHITRENSEPNFRTNSELFTASTQFLRINGQSLENILENDESEVDLRTSQVRGADRAEALVLEDEDFVLQKPNLPSIHNNANRGAIPKKTDTCSRVTINPMSETNKKLPNSRTYFCLKSILKQNRRRYTLVTTDELQNLVGMNQGQIFTEDYDAAGPGTSGGHNCSSDCCGMNQKTPNINWNRRKSLDNSNSHRTQLFRDNLENWNSRRNQWFTPQRRENSRTLIFASPIQEICPTDPFGGRTVVSSENPPNYEDALNLPVLSRLKRSFTERDSRNGRPNIRKHHRTFSIEPEYLFQGHSIERSYQADGLPYDGAVPRHDSRFLVQSNRLPSQHCVRPSQDCGPMPECNATAVCNQNDEEPRDGLCRLTRSLTERSSSRRRPDRSLRRSFTERMEFNRNGNRRTNINMETSL